MSSSVEGGRAELLSDLAAWRDGLADQGAAVPTVVPTTIPSVPRPSPSPIGIHRHILSALLVLLMVGVVGGPLVGLLLAEPVHVLIGNLVLGG